MPNKSLGRSGRLAHANSNSSSYTNTAASTISAPAFPDKMQTPVSSSRRAAARRGRGRTAVHPASRTLDLGKLGRDEELGIHEGAPAQLRSGGIAAFFRNLFSRNDDLRTRPKRSVPDHRYSTAGAAGGGGGGGGPTMASSGRLGRHAAASSLGSLQSYATSTIRASSGPIPSCLSQGSTSEVGMKKRVHVRKDRDDEPLFSKEVRDNTLMSNRPERFVYPNFALAEFGGRDTWSSDVFVLPHNAIRWEIMDLYTIISSIQRRWSSLKMIDVWELSEYWEVFEVFVAQYFEIEDQIVFPFMLNVASESGELKRYHKVVKYNRDRLENMLHDVGATLEKFNTNAAGDVMPKIYLQLFEYLPKLLDYMEQQEKVLPEVFAAFCEPEDRALLNRAAANFIVRAANGRDGIAILTRWIEDSMVLQIWKNENLSARAQSSHKRWISGLEASHVDVARRFQRRMRSLPKDEGGERSGGKLPADGGRSIPDRVDPVRKSGNKNSLKGGVAASLGGRIAT